MTDKDYKELEAILLEYVEKFGLLPSARQFFLSQGSAETERTRDISIVPARKSA